MTSSGEPSHQRIGGLSSTGGPALLRPAVVPALPEIDPEVAGGGGLLGGLDALGQDLTTVGVGDLDDRRRRTG